MMKIVLFCQTRLWRDEKENEMPKKTIKKEPTSIITFGISQKQETLSSLLDEFNSSYGDYHLIKINGKKAKRDFKIVSGGDIISLYKKTA